MNAKAYGKLAALVIWPALACLSVWRIAGGMPPAIEKIYLGILWGLAVLFFICALGAWLAWMLGMLGERKASEPRKLDPVFFVVVLSSRLTMLIALLLSGDSVLAGLLMVALLGMSALGSLLRKQATTVSD